MCIIRYQREAALDGRFRGENGERLFFIKVKSPEIPQPAPLPQFPQPPPLPQTAQERPTVVTQAGAAIPVGATGLQALTIEDIVAGRDLPALQEFAKAPVEGHPLSEVLRFRTPESVYAQAQESAKRRTLAKQLLAEAEAPPEAETSDIGRFSGAQRQRFRTQVEDDAETARLRLMEELNVRGLLGSTGDQGESGLRGNLERARLEALTEAESRADLIGEDLRRTRRSERLGLVNQLEAGLTADQASAAGLTPVSQNLEQARAANEAQRFQSGPLANFNAQVADRNYRSQVAQANAQTAFQASAARAQSFAGLAGSAGLMAALKKR